MMFPDLATIIGQAADAGPSAIASIAERAGSFAVAIVVLIYMASKQVDRLADEHKASRLVMESMRDDMRELRFALVMAPRNGHRRAITPPPIDLLAVDDLGDDDDATTRKPKA